MQTLVPLVMVVSRTVSTQARCTAIVFLVQAGGQQALAGPSPPSPHPFRACNYLFSQCMGSWFCDCTFKTWEWSRGEKAGTHWHRGWAIFIFSTKKNAEQLFYCKKRGRKKKRFFSPFSQCEWERVRKIRVGNWWSDDLGGSLKSPLNSKRLVGTKCESGLCVSCMTTGKSPRPSTPQIPHLQNRADNSFLFVNLLSGLSRVNGSCCMKVYISKVQKPDIPFSDRVPFYGHQPGTSLCILRGSPTQHHVAHVASLTLGKGEHHVNVFGRSTLKC